MAAVPRGRAGGTVTEQQARAVLAALGIHPSENKHGFAVRGVPFVAQAPTLPELAEACLKSARAQLDWWPGDLEAFEARRRKIDEEQQATFAAHLRLKNRYEHAALLARDKEAT